MSTNCGREIFFGEVCESDSVKMQRTIAGVSVIGYWLLASGSPRSQVALGNADVFEAELRVAAHLRPFALAGISDPSYS